MNAVIEQANQLFEQAPWLARITDDEDYLAARKLMAELIANEQEQSLLLDVLAATIDRWEKQALEVKAFNQRVDDLDNGVAALRVLMEQYGLGGADLPEIGSKSLVSKVLKGERGLTRKHILKLSERFGISPMVFF